MTDRLYYSDSYLTNFAARVTDIRELSRTEGQSVWQIALDRTAFYPTSGGQPHDLGLLTATARGGAVLEVEVEAVEEDEHGEVWHHTAKPLLAGTRVEGVVDRDRRMDHIQQHSGQHLLSAVFARELKAKTVSFHLGETVSTIDLASEAVAHHSLERVERIANGLIAEDRAVSVHNVERTEAEALLAAGKLRKLPERDGAIRLIEIADYDLNACGGTHVRSTGQIGGLLVRGIEKVKQGLRVEFVCGLRAVAAARHDFSTLTRIGAALSVGRAETPEAVERVLAEAKAAQKERLKLREDLAAYHAARLAVEEQIHGGLREVRRTFVDRDAAYVKLLASRIIASVPQTMAILVSEQQDPATIVLAASHDLEIHCGNLLRDALAQSGLRGGGSADLAQGEAPRSHAGELIQVLAASARAAAKKPAAQGR